MKFKNGKCVEISKKEYDDIMLIWNISTCLADGYDKVYEYMEKDNKFGVLVDYYIKKRIATNILDAVINKYKYLKIIN